MTSYKPVILADLIKSFHRAPQDELLHPVILDIIDVHIILLSLDLEYCSRENYELEIMLIVIETHPAYSRIHILGNAVMVIINPY